MALEVSAHRAHRARRGTLRVSASAPRRLRLAAAFAASALVACLGCDDARAPRPEPPAASSNTAPNTEDVPLNTADDADRRLAALREQAHITLSEYCGNCHTRSQPTAVPGALAVFDLDEPDWYAAFNRNKFPGAKRRIAGEATDDERRTFEAWVDAELARMPAGAAQAAP